MAVNVPLDNRLARNGAVHWRGYQQSWARTDHIRALLSIAGVARLLLPAQP